jgi:glycosyltransferase involved in cell wall biosynthesis
MQATRATVWRLRCRDGRTGSYGILSRPPAVPFIRKWVMSLSSPLVSVITPTFNRPHILPTIHKCVAGQDMADFEWLVLDDSPVPSEFMMKLDDPRIFYDHLPERRSVGMKRNLLISRARGEIIAQFDDDDFYGKGYLSGMMSVMRNGDADFVKLFGFFMYSQLHDLFAFWDLRQNEGPHYEVGNAPLRLTRLDQAAFRNNYLGYGFSYVFKKRVWDSVNFIDQDWNEDAVFAIKAAEKFNIVGTYDLNCACLHILHRANTSVCLPQYILPRFLLDRLFPSVDEHLGKPPR